MVKTEMRIAASAEDVFDVLADGWSYAGWVVGASHIREVDPGWPAEGTRIHHSVGPWPLHVQDVTRVLHVVHGRLIDLEARMWPVGSARVRLTLTPAGPDATDVLMEEEVTQGPGRVIPTPVQAMLLKPRNAEALRRLADIAKGRG
ncbi:SRPBCC family protein [Allokutzneria sp. A3M-2-11 16]|uniref:SRPBCC family protein n=1 Tax=Allokutzneria sp. A3M-2-11 16 TaxID=2962043 RepID=UPI0020B83111|nr:SRPBCC family protein [Allokutzneria sp. A3M-2-11 16]MCP3804716.1 SRPBCC family protein [Allokutzneria sp. A3M-2-11 16]